MKKFFIVFIVFISCFVSFSQTVVFTSSGQPIVKIPMNYAASNKLRHYKYDYAVFYKDKSTKQVTGRITYDTKADKYFLKSGKQKVYCDETEYIYRIEKNNIDTVLGFFNENMWLFSVINGEIMGYSKYSSNQKSYITHLQKNEGQLIEYSKKELKKEFADLIKDDTESYELFLKDKKRRKIRTIAPPIIFVTCLTTAIVAPFESALMFVAWFGTPVLPITPLFVKRISPIEIIEKYNENKSIVEK